MSRILTLLTLSLISTSALADTPICRPQVFVKNTKAGPLYECTPPLTTNKAPSLELITQTTGGACRRVGKHSFNCTLDNPGAKEIYNAIQGIYISEKPARGM